MEAVAPALLQSAIMAGTPYILKELQPSEDRLSLEEWNGKISRLENIVATMARVSAWSQLRGSGRQGSAIADELIAWAERGNWQGPLLKYAQAYSKQVEADWKSFRDAAI